MPKLCDLHGESWHPLPKIDSQINPIYIYVGWVSIFVFLFRAFLCEIASFIQLVEKELAVDPLSFHFEISR